MSGTFSFGCIALRKMHLYNMVGIEASMFCPPHVDDIVQNCRAQICCFALHIVVEIEASLFCVAHVDKYVQ